MDVVFWKVGEQKIRTISTSFWNWKEHRFVAQRNSIVRKERVAIAKTSNHGRTRKLRIFSRKTTRSINHFRWGIQFHIVAEHVRLLFCHRLGKHCEWQQGYWRCNWRNDKWYAMATGRQFRSRQSIESQLPSIIFGQKPSRFFPAPEYGGRISSILFLEAMEESSPFYLLISVVLP